MSKESDRKRQVIEDAVQQMDAEQKKIQQERYREELNKGKEAAKPSLLKRIGAGLLDFLFAAALAVGLYLFSYFNIFPHVGYNTASETMLSIYADSGLYEMKDGELYKLTQTYEATDSLEEHYDKPIITFYKLHAYEDTSSTKTLLEMYNERRLNSGYYQLEGEEIVLKDDVEKDKLKEFLEKEYNTALNNLFSNPEVIKAGNIVFNTVSLSLLIIVTISSIVFYFVVPLIDKKNRTFAYMICKIMPVDTKTLKIVGKSPIIFRSLIFVIITYISPVTIYFWLWGITGAFIPFFINLVIMSFSRHNTALHDLGSQTVVINESYSSPFETLKQITGQGGNN